METIKVFGRDHVIVESTYRGPQHEKANYLGMNVALAGVMLKGETLEQWQARKNNPTK